MTQVVEAKLVEESYKENYKRLTTRERDVVTRYYGIKPHVRHTLQEIGNMYGVTRERVRQIKVEALRKLESK